MSSHITRKAFVLYITSTSGTRF